MERVLCFTYHTTNGGVYHAPDPRPLMQYRFTGLCEDEKYNDAELQYRNQL